MRLFHHHVPRGSCRASEEGKATRGKGPYERGEDRVPRGQGVGGDDVGRSPDGWRQGRQGDPTGIPASVGAGSSAPGRLSALHRRHGLSLPTMH